MATPESTVFLRREGTGAAQVFGHPADVLRALDQNEANKRRREDIARADQWRLKQDRDKKIGELLLTDPEKTFQPFNDQVLAAAAAHRKNTLDLVEKQGPSMVDNPEFKIWNKNKWNDVNSIARKGNFLKDLVDSKRKEIDANPNLDKDMLHSALNDTYMDHSGNGHPIDKVNIDDINGVIDRNPQAFKPSGYADDFLKNIKDKVFNYNQIQRDAEGVTSTDTDIKMKEGIYRPDPNAVDGIQRDAKGNPIINATPEVIRGFMADKYAKNYVNYTAEQTGRTPKEIIEDILVPKMGVDKKKTMSFKYSPTAFNFDAFGLHPRDAEKANRRLQNVSALADTFVDEEGYLSDKPTEKAKEILGYIKANAKFGGADIVDAFPVKGTEEAGSQEVNGVSVENKPYDRIVFKTKQGTKGRIQIQEIDISDKKAATAELNSVFETAKTEGGFKIGYDVLRNIDEQRFNNEYLKSDRQIREGTSNEKAMNKEIVAWQRGDNFNSMIGKDYEGKKIVGVSHVKPVWGSNYLELKLNDGSTAQIKASDSEDAKKLKEVYLSGFKGKVKLAGKRGEASGMSAVFE